MSAQETALVAKDVRKTFKRDAGKPVDALAGISLHVARGKLTALVGPDGAGKTTLLRLAAGLVAPDAGSIEVISVSMSSGRRSRSRTGSAICLSVSVSTKT
ncbi:ATP-binding cassette domain-containing protein [Rhizobium sp. IBUN]|uniref:ATP-binding cassette domain-containing protein n=1 Tax=Rhizobium sp. IBUN TaxID=1042326 RepID=UPI00042874E8|nr:ATP-binding cassette domain-containing protein [Rhizobium sp. IBUN]